MKTALFSGQAWRGYDCAAAGFVAKKKRRAPVQDGGYFLQQ
ncbi:hypothetical protein [Morganella morganii]|nr:hypothetical protein [Morganella morganii]